MTKLNDVQLILLSNASQREDGNVLPLPGSVVAAEAKTQKAITALLKRKLLAEAPVPVAGAAWRRDGDDAFGLFITDAGREAIGAGEREREPTGHQHAPAPEQPKVPRQSKSATVIALLKRGEGATLAELIDATGWLPHTTRAALTGLRKKGHTIEKSKRDEATCYRILATA